MTLQVIRDGVTLAAGHTSSLVLSIYGNPAPHTLLTALQYTLHLNNTNMLFSKD